MISAKAFSYGYYEARFKVPPGAGWHSSFWLMTHDGSGGTNTKVTKQELDIIENDSVNPMGYGVNTHKWNPEPHVGMGGKRVKTPNLSADFHTFGCEFTPTVVRYYFDNTLVQTVDDTKLPAAAIFDYVRFYERTR